MPNTGSPHLTSTIGPEYWLLSEVIKWDIMWLPTWLLFSMNVNPTLLDVDPKGSCGLLSVQSSGQEAQGGFGKECRRFWEAPLWNWKSSLLKYKQDFQSQKGDTHMRLALGFPGLPHPPEALYSLPHDVASLLSAWISTPSPLWKSCLLKDISSPLCMEGNASSGVQQ